MAYPLDFKISDTVLTPIKSAKPADNFEVRLHINNFINIGKKDGLILSNGWTAVTRDKSLSAQFEHSIGVTSNGCEVFTYSPKGLDKPPYK